jgi:hypothetical protein
MNKLIFLGLIPVLMPTVPNVYASEYVRQADRPAINPDFDPDESCRFDAFQGKCTLGAEQECPDGFGGNQYGTCFPVNKEGYMDCPEGTHSIEGDETGQCYPNDEQCWHGTMMNEEHTECIIEK